MKDNDKDEGGPAAFCFTCTFCSCIGFVVWAVMLIVRKANCLKDLKCNAISGLCKDDISNSSVIGKNINQDLMKKYCDIENINWALGLAIFFSCYLVLWIFNIICIVCTREKSDAHSSSNVVHNYAVSRANDSENKVFIQVPLQRILDSPPLYTETCNKTVSCIESEALPPYDASKGQIKY